MAIAWLKRVGIAAAVIPLIIGCLWTVTGTTIAVLIAVSLGCLEYQLLRSLLLSDIFERNCNNNDIMNHWELYVFGALPVFAAALSTVHLEGWFLCVTTALPFLPPLASIIRFIMVADPKAEDGNRKRVAVMVMHYCIDVHFLFHFAWGTSFLVLLRHGKSCGFHYALFVLACNWMADTGALVVGSMFGKRKV
eukprot:Selendium_serpulae@DN3810_c0_g1_i5.p1